MVLGLLFAFLLVAMFIALCWGDTEGFHRILDIASWWGGAMILAGFLLSIIAIIKRTDGGDVPIAVTNPVWDRCVPEMPIKGNVLSDLSLKISDLVKCAHEWIIKNTNAEITEECVRANIFLPDSKDANLGEPCVLYIPKGLHAHMRDGKERDILFRPNEGLTGMVFSNQVPLAAKRTMVGEQLGSWERIDISTLKKCDEDEFFLNELHVRLIAEDLRWVIANPIKVQCGDRSLTIGVCNVDCLGAELDKNDLQNLHGHLRDRLDAIAEDVAKIPKKRLLIDINKV